MAKQKKEPKIKPSHLLDAGYTWKPSVLTDEQRDWANNGVPTDKPHIRGERPNYFYYFKTIGDVEVRVYKVIRDLYYNAVRLRHPSQLANVEKAAIEAAKYAAMEAQLTDTEPAHEVLETTAGFVRTADAPDANTLLVGGPMDGFKVKYHHQFKLYVGQVRMGERVIAAQYKQRAKEPHIYDFLRDL